MIKKRIPSLKINKKLRLLILIFIALLPFILYFSAFSSIGLQTDPDSHTYLYLVDKKMEGASFFSVQRPPVFPTYLFLISKITDNYSILYLILNYLIRSLSVLITTWAIFSITKNKIASLLGFLISASNLQLLQHINYVNPEIVLNLFLMTHTYIVWKLLLNPSWKNIIFLLISFFLMTFTKPIFIFYPFLCLLLLGIFFFKKISSKKFIRRKLPLITLLFFFLYLIPIYSWSKYNFSKNHIFSFSVIADINLTGKIMQYNLVEDGPNDLIYQPLKSALVKKGDYKNVFHRFPLIFETTPENIDPFIFMGEYSKKTIFKNPIQYSLLSLKEIPKVLTSIPENRSELFYMSEQSNPAINAMFFLFLRTWELIRETYYLLLVGAVFGFTTLLSKSKKNNLKIKYLLILISIWAYINSIIAFTAYDSYTRLKSIGDDIFIIILISCFYFLFKFLFPKIIKYISK